LERVAALLGNSVKIVEKHYAPWGRGSAGPVGRSGASKLDETYKIAYSSTELFKNPIKTAIKLAGAGGLEPPPSSLTVRCPTDWTTPQLLAILP
jgi:hypothetical protein